MFGHNLNITYMPTQKTSLQGSPQAQSSALVQGMFFVQHHGVQPPRTIVGNGTTNGVSTMPMPKFECCVAFLPTNDNQTALHAEVNRTTLE